MPFNVEDFVEKLEESLSLTLLESLTKPELIELATHFGISALTADIKHVIKQQIIEVCVSRGILQNPKAEPDVVALKRLELEFETQLKMKALELEAQERREKVEAQERREKLEAQEWREKAELEARELEARLAHEIKLKELELSHSSITSDYGDSRKFNTAKYIRTSQLSQRKMWINTFSILRK